MGEGAESPSEPGGILSWRHWGRRRRPREEAHSGGLRRAAGRSRLARKAGYQNYKDRPGGLLTGPYLLHVPTSRPSHVTGEQRGRGPVWKAAPPGALGPGQLPSAWGGDEGRLACHEQPREQPGSESGNPSSGPGSTAYKKDDSRQAPYYPCLSFLSHRDDHATLGRVMRLKS